LSPIAFSSGADPSPSQATPLLGAPLVQPTPDAQQPARASDEIKTMHLENMTSITFPLYLIRIKSAHMWIQKSFTSPLNGLKTNFPKLTEGFRC
jgi:hypothetical protein